MNRGSRIGRRRAGLARVASMRPRFMNRGSDFGERGWERSPADASMRPRFMNRGSQTRDMAEQAAKQASMRPRFMNRGSRHRLRHHVLKIVASMRPRFMNRGSSELVVLRLAGDAGFNEAPIHESGKCMDGHRVHPVQRASMRPRFMNRGSRSGSGCSRMLSAASMRPRFMNRGSGRAATQHGRASARFNEAPIHESGKSRPGTIA